MLRKVVKVALIVGLILIIFGGTVLAATGRVTGNNVRIRAKASSNSEEKSVATKNEKVEILGEEGNWYYVKFENVTGYMSKDYVERLDSEPIGQVSTTETEQPVSEPEPTVTEPEPDPEPEKTEPEPEVVSEPVETIGASEVTETVTLDHDVNLRYIPSFSSRVRVTATSGTTYNVVASLNHWVKLENDTNSGWVLKNSLEGADTSTSTNTDTNTNTSTDTTTPTEETKGTVNVDSARIRKTPDGEVLDSVSKGTEVTILGEEGDWYKIKTAKFDSGYIAKRLVTKN